MRPSLIVDVRGGDPEVVVIGGGVAGMTAGAVLASRGRRVLVLEQHRVAGGCASFYQRDGYRFDVGATLVGGFGPRGVHRRLFDRLEIALEAEAVDPAMMVHLPDRTIARYGDERWGFERRRAFGLEMEPFWDAQERIADRAWDLATRLSALPADAGTALRFVRALRPQDLMLGATAGRTVAQIFPPAASSRFRTFIDAQLLITAQAGADTADLTYGATALDLAREGTYHLPGGVSSIAIALARSIRRRGSQIAYGTAAAAIETSRGAVRAVRLADGTRIVTRRVVAAVPGTNVAALVERGGGTYARAASVRSLPLRWGAFMAYVGLPSGVVPDDLALHHQLVRDADAPLGEGNSTFLSLSPPGEAARARNGGRAVTISTHTDVARWERAFDEGRDAALRQRYGAELLAALDRVVPGAAARAEMIAFATPHTFARYTGRSRGLVGGVPQTVAFANLRAQTHRSGIEGLVLAGDTVFPGQSTVGASISGAAAADAVQGWF